MNIQDDINSLHSYESFARFIKMIHELREETISEMHEASSETIQQVSGRIITYDQILNCDHEFAPGVDTFTADSPAPLIADANGRYPVPQPGIVTTREY